MRQALPVYITLLLIWMVYTLYLIFSGNLARPVKLDNVAARGKRVWQEQNCASCHQVYSLGGYLGPDLTNVYAKGGDAYIRAFVRTGTKVMPAFHLDKNDEDALVAYLRELNNTGKSDPAHFEVQPDGMISP